MTQLANVKELTIAEEVDRITPSIERLVSQPLETQVERDGVASFVERAYEPASEEWLRARVLVLLSQYYVAAMPEQVMRAIAADWYHELKGYPEWAILRACRWWISKDNPKKHTKPVVGQISERCHVEMTPVRIGEWAVNRFDRREQ